MAQPLFTSESVTQGHPDKMADQISDAIVDDLLGQDARARIAVETLLTTGQVHVAGEVTTDAYAEINRIVREVVLGIGYDDGAKGFDGRTCGINVSLGSQSADIAQGVDTSFELRVGDAVDPYAGQGAGDQGLMFGYASDETDEFMPLPITVAHALARKLAEVREQEVLPYLRPDGKTQVTIDYSDAGAPIVRSIVISTQHAEDVEQDQIATDVRAHVIEPLLTSPQFERFVDGSWNAYINPTGKFTVGGPMGDAGLTGRKIIVDTYGGMARHGGGAFSGKDPSKVDRSAAYAMRWVAKNVVAAGLAKRCEVQVAYAIGMSSPVGVFVETFGTGSVHDSLIQTAIEAVFDLRPGAIIDHLQLLAPIYQPTATYGHFGRAPYTGPVRNRTTGLVSDADFFTWERVNRVEELNRAVRG